MTGLDPTNDVILQICCYITSPTLDLLEPSGFETVVSRPRDVLENMNEWCIKTHNSTGLVSRCLSSSITAAQASSMLLSYIKTHVPEPGKALLAGNTVHADKMFLMKECPEVIEWLGYRILDVSAIKEGARRWCSEEVLAGAPKKEGTHEARMDILESIEECRYWKKVLFDGR